jgi:hypothetical protein
VLDEGWVSDTRRAVCNREDAAGGLSFIDV